MPAASPATGLLDHADDRFAELMASGTLSTAVTAQRGRMRDDLAALVRLQSVHGDPARVAHCRASAAWVARALADLPLDDVEIVESPGGSFSVLASRAAPPGAATVVLYSHHDVQPAGPEAAWDSAPFTLADRGGRWYGRGAADGKGDLIAQLTALRTLSAGELPGLRILVDGAAGRGGGLAELLRRRPDAAAGDLVVVGDAGNVALGVPTLTTSMRGTAAVTIEVAGLTAAAHAGSFGGAAPDALAGLLTALASLRGPDGETTVDGLDAAGTWHGAPYDADAFRADAAALPGTRIPTGAAIADAVWARPATTVVALDAPRTHDAVAAIAPRARAVVDLRVPSGVDVEVAQRALAAHLRAHVPSGLHVDVTLDAAAVQPFRARTDGPAVRLLADALAEAYDTPVVHTGQGGSIPLCGALAEVAPHAEVAVLGVAEPGSAVHAPNESVDPRELVRTATALALALRRFGRARRT